MVVVVEALRDRLDQAAECEQLEQERQEQLDKFEKLSAISLEQRDALQLYRCSSDGFQQVFRERLAVQAQKAPHGC